MTEIQPRVGLVQRVLPVYRIPFFETLTAHCQGGLGLFAGTSKTSEMIEEGDTLRTARLTRGRNIHLFSGRFYLCWQSGLLNWLNEWQPEVLILEANPRYLRIPAAARWMHRRRRAVIGWGLGAHPAQGFLAGAREFLRKRFLYNFDAIITYSRKGAEEYIAAGFPAGRVFVAPNAVTPRPTRPMPLRPPTFTERPVVIFVGRLQQRKRLDVLIRACARLPEAFQPELWIVGDGPVRADLEQLAGDVYPRTKFLGSLHGSELEPLFCAADLFVLPGTGGLALQQAMSYGLPVMAAEADGTQVDLVRAENGWQLVPGDIDMLATVLAQALSDAGRLRRMGEASYQIVAKEINLEKMVQVFSEAISVVQRG